MFLFDMYKPANAGENQIKKRKSLKADYETLHRSNDIKRYNGKRSDKMFLSLFSGHFSSIYRTLVDRQMLFWGKEDQNN